MRGMERVHQVGREPPHRGWRSPCRHAIPRAVHVQELTELLRREATRFHALLQQIGERGFTQFWDIPLFWVPLELTINPTIVADFAFPGVLNGAWSHYENIKAVKG